MIGGVRFAANLTAVLANGRRHVDDVRMQANYRLAVVTALGSSCALAASVPAGMVRVSDAARHSLAPDVTVDSRGNVAIIWLDKEPATATAPASDAGMEHAGMQHGAGAAPDRHLSSMDLYFARSTDGGRRFSKPLRVNREPGQVWGFAVSKPKIAIAPTGTIHIAYPANAVSSVPGKSVLVMYYTRSNDGGKSFEQPRLLHQIPALDQSAFMDGGFTTAHAFGSIGVAPDGSVHAIWVDTRDWDRERGAGSAYYARSTDDGRTFTAEAAALPTDVCPCCQIMLAFDAASNVYVGARQVTGDGHRNSSIGRIPAGSNKVSQRAGLATVPWKLEGCPLKPTVVAVDGNTVYAAAYHGGENPAGVYAAVSANGGASFAAEFAIHPDATVSDAPALVLAGGAQPIIAWHAKTTAVRRVFWRSLARGGGSMGAINELAAPQGSAQAPALAARPDGRVQLAWQQGEQILTTIIDARGARRVAR